MFRSRGLCACVPFDFHDSTCLYQGSLLSNSALRAGVLAVEVGSPKKKDLQSHPSLKPGGVWFYRVFLLYHMDFWEANWQDNHLGVSERMMRHQFKEVFLKSKTCKTVYGNLWSCIIPNIQCVWRLLKPIQPIPVTPNLPSCGQVFLDLAPGKRSLDLSLALSKRLKLNKNCGSDTPLQTYLVSV